MRFFESSDGGSSRIRRDGGRAGCALPARAGCDSGLWSAAPTRTTSTGSPPTSSSCWTIWDRVRRVLGYSSGISPGVRAIVASDSVAPGDTPEELAEWVPRMWIRATDAEQFADMIESYPTWNGWEEWDILPALETPVLFVT